MVDATDLPQSRSKSYSDKLRDPKWQKKRLEILSRDQFRCVFYNDDTITLNVHHCYYAARREPWQYPNSSLLTLCEDCHESETVAGKTGRDSFIRALAERGICGLDMDYLSYLLDKIPETTDRKTIYETLIKAIHILSLDAPHLFAIGDRE